jgi:phage terminase small subunit
MHQPGRVSVDAASVVVPPEATLPTDRPQPPAHLGERERAEWAAIIARMGEALLPRETHGLLATFCAVKIQLETINEALAAFGARVPEDKQGWQRYRELTRMRGQLSGQLSSLAVKLRLAPSARYDRHWVGAEARRRAGRPPPWAAASDPLCG